MLWVFGLAGDIVDINMRGTFGNHAIVRSRLFNPAIYEEMPGLHRLHVKQRMMYLLAGYAAASRFSDRANATWLDDCLDEWECVKGDDLHQAFDLAKSVWGDNGNAWRMLRRMASWTDEALSNPRLWAVVNALAEQLLTVKTRISGNRVCKTMNDVWGEIANLPYMEMGRHWRRRFSFRG
jgi:hypothetical protein